MQFAYWTVGIIVGALTIGAATARVVGELANMEKAVALLQNDVGHMNESLKRLERMLEGAPRSQ
jgi:hypothetical protein